MKLQQLVMGGLVLSSTATFADIIFSEYIEGSSNNKAIELMNTGDASVDLSNYRIELYSNGKETLQNSLTLSGDLAAGQVYVIANASATSDILDVADTTSTVTYFNGNDVLLLRQNNAVVDRIGQLGNANYFGANVTLVRKDSISSGDTAYDQPFDPSLQWDSYPQDTITYLGDGNTTEPVDMACHNPAVLISDIQGTASRSAMTGEMAVVEAIVTASLQANDELRGFFIQEEDSDADGDSQSSEGLFVYYDDTAVAVGDQVRLYGEIKEFGGLTELTQIQALTVCSQNNSLPSAAEITFPLDDLAELETVEGMQLQLPETLTVNEVYNLGRYGQFMIGEGRRRQPTDIAAPGPDADAVATANALNTLIVDDGKGIQNPDPIIFPTPGLDAKNTLRVGDQVNQLAGVLYTRDNEYQLIPTQAPQFYHINLRTETPYPVHGSNLRAAAFNVLNYFNGDGEGGGFPTERGAASAYELERQTAKLVAAITAMDADIVGLLEIENDGFGELSAIATLTAAINAELPAYQQYDYITLDVEKIGRDVIANGLLYRPTTVAPTGAAQLLDSSNSPLDDNGEPLFIDSLNRPILQQTLIHKRTGETVAIAVGHLKSKRTDDCADYDDCDTGQGAYNKVRTKAVTALANWLQDAAGSDNILLLGDWNAYSKEDPITTLLNAGYSLLNEENGYSYVYSGETGAIDHALVNGLLLTRVLGVQHWHINTDEPKVLDYLTRYKSEAQLLSLYAPDPFRSSDHDPVIVDLHMNAGPIARARAIPFFFWYLFISDSYDRDGFISEQVWQLGDYQFTGAWFAVPRNQLLRQQLSEFTLTVYDNDGASASISKNLDCFGHYCGRAKPARHHF